MVLMTGDIVDRGGYSAQWNSLFAGLPALERYQQATLPGNHEYYHDNDPSYIDASIYNQFYNNPQNGPEDRLNSSYYFRYGDALIIMLDIMPNTKNPYDLEANKAWFKEVVQNNPSRWIIVGSHAGAITAGIYAHDAKQIWNNWSETFEECQVDLALSGHEHIYIRKDLWYQGEYNEELGVTYLVGPAAGQKDYAAQNTEGLTVKRGNYRGQIVKLQGTKMTVSLYDTTGTEFATFTLNAKRNGSPAEITDEELLNYSVDGMRIVMATFPIIAFPIVIGNFFQSIGKAKKSIVLSLSRQVLFLIPLLLILPNFLGIKGVWWSLPISDVIATILSLIMIARYYKYDVKS